MNTSQWTQIKEQMTNGTNEIGMWMKMKEKNKMRMALPRP